MKALSGQILIVEDEVNIRAGLGDILARDGHIVTGVGSGEEALKTLALRPCEVAVVDIRMPGISGIELLQAIRARWQHMGVIILTGHGDLKSAMAAIKAGAHDYLLKPAQPDAIRQTVVEALITSRRRKEQERLLESLRASLNRLDGVTDPGKTSSPTEPHLLEIGDLHIDLRSHQVYRNGASIHLSPTEFKLLAALAVHVDEVVEYTTLAQLGLGYETTLWEAKELLKRHIFSLRHRLEPNPNSPCYLLNVRGVGYRLAAPD